MAKKQIRKKVVTLDGAEFTIAPLTLDQIDEYVAPLEDIASQKSIGFRKGFQVVCYGLNNALPEDAPDSEKWTQERIKNEIDLILFEHLQNEIIAFSGFLVDKTNAPAIPGESSAASEKGSSQTVGTEDSVSTSVTSDVA